MNYVWSGPSTISFGTAPNSGDAVEIRRVTSPTATLVDFVNGSVLNESDLDTAYLHNFYLSQEANDGFNQLINETLIRIGTDIGIIDTETADIINALVAEILKDDAAGILQARVSDIDTNAESIVQLGSSLQVQMNTLAQGVAAQVFVQAGEPIPGVSGVPDPISEGARWYDSDDNNEAYIYISSEWISISDPRVGTMVSQIAVIQTDVDDNVAAIVSEQVARSTADTAFASELGLLGAQNGAQTAFILDSSTVKIDSDSGDTVATRLSQLDATDSTNASAITTEESARITADGVNATAISALDTRVTTAEGDVVANASAIDLTEADIVTNAGNITTQASQITALQSSVNLRARTYFQSTAPTADNVGDLWIDSDDDSLSRWNGSTWVSIEDAAIAGNASAITGLDTRVTTAEGNITSTASDVTTLQASVSTLDGEVSTAQITANSAVTASTNNATGITTLGAVQGIRLDVDDYVTGYIQNNDGKQGNFIIRADRFAVIDPEAEIGDGTVPFTVVDGTVKMQDVEINGSLILNGSVVGDALEPGTITATQIDTNAITADAINVTNLAAINADLGSITAGNITLDNSGYIKGGQTAFDTDVGFFLGYEGGEYVFSLGDPAGDSIKWDGSQLTIVGDVHVGEYIPSDEILLSADSLVLDTQAGVWTKQKEFSIDRDGTLRVSAEARETTGVGGITPQWRIKTDGVVRKTFNVTSFSYVEESWDVPVTQGGSVEIELYAAGNIQLINARVKGRVIIPPTGGSVILD